MHVSSLGSTVPPDSPGKSRSVPPGLQRRDLELPPGIAKKLEAGGTVPPGIAKRFPAAVTPTETSSETTTETSPADGATVDILA
jgi:hypothetical protein